MYSDDVIIIHPNKKNITQLQDESKVMMHDNIMVMMHDNIIFVDGSIHWKIKG